MRKQILIILSILVLAGILLTIYYNPHQEIVTLVSSEPQYLNGVVIP